MSLACISNLALRRSGNILSKAPAVLYSPIDKPGLSCWYVPCRGARLGPSFFEEYDKGMKKYQDIIDAKTQRLTADDTIKGFHIMNRDLKRVWNEFKEYLQSDGPLLDVRNGDYTYAYKMNCQEDLAGWEISSDRVWDDGYSEATLALTADNKALFSGHLSTKLPKDKDVVRAGWTSIGSPQRTLFGQVKLEDWTMFNNLVLRVRGDGRVYDLNIQMGYHRNEDVHKYDIYNYQLFTRGGPYWQIVKIPFSNFFLTHKGCVQDDQDPMPAFRVKRFLIGLYDALDGPFRLEIDYVALMYDAAEIVDTKYEMYTTDSPLH